MVRSLLVQLNVRYLWDILRDIKKTIRLISTMFWIKVRARNFGVIKTEVPIVKTTKVDYITRENTGKLVHILLFPETKNVN